MTAYSETYAQILQLHIGIAFNYFLVYQSVCVRSGLSNKFFELGSINIHSEFYQNTVLFELILV